MIFFARNNRLGFVTILFVPLIEVRNLTKVFPLGESAFGGGSKGEVRAVDDVSLDVHSGETLGLVGESGSGKSTLGRLILRLIEPTSGSVSFEGRDLLKAGHGEMRRLRSDMQIIFQDPFSSLDPRMPVEDLIAEPMVIHRSPTSRKGGEKWGSMTTITSQAVIAKPPAAVFDYVTTPAHWLLWHPSSLGLHGATDHSLQIGDPDRSGCCRLGKCRHTSTSRSDAVSVAASSEPGISGFRVDARPIAASR